MVSGDGPNHVCIRLRPLGHHPSKLHKLHKHMRRHHSRTSHSKFLFGAFHVIFLLRKWRKQISSWLLRNTDFVHIYPFPCWTALTKALGRLLIDRRPSTFSPPTQEFLPTFSQVEKLLSRNHLTYYYLCLHYYFCYSIWQSISYFNFN